MRRGDRLYGLAEELRRSGDKGRTAASLAEQFEVSTRTIKRDISALQHAGMPIWAQSGPGGGYQLLPSASNLPPLTFTASEAAAVAIALQLHREQPFAPEGSTALTKILSAMNGAAQVGVDDLLARIWTTNDGRRSPVAGTVDDAIQQGRRLSLLYTDRHGNPTRRRVDPVALAHAEGQWYLLGYCHLRKAGRWFRLDRIQRARLTAHAADHRDPVALFGTPPEQARQLAGHPGRRDM